MANLNQLRAQFPEANGVSDILCLAMLNAASLDMSTLVWGAFGVLGGPSTKADQGQMYLAMHKLAVSPFGQNAKVKIDGKKVGYARTTYGEEFLLLQRGVTGGFRVA